jgi:hypothetical protein
VKRLLPLLFLFAGVEAIAQKKQPPDIDFERLVDDLLPFQDAELNYEEIMENWMQLLNNPLDINRASRADLRELYLLTDAQIDALITHRETNGDFLSLYELQAVPGFSTDLIERLSPFIRIPAGEKFTERLREAQVFWLGRLERRLEQRRGFTTTDPAQRFAGSQEKIYQRFRFYKANTFSAGWVAEKDAGEKFEFSNRQLGFDYQSAHVQVQKTGKLKNLVVGDFQPQFGQGLVLGGGFSLGKGGETILTTRRNTLGFLPYSSVIESGFLRGVGASVSVSRRITAHGFVSSNRRDGRIRTDTTGTFASSLPLSGLHRTPGERQVRRTLEETSLGAVVQYQSRYIEAGALWHQASFSPPVNRPANLYNQFAFAGNQNQNGSVFVSAALKNASFFGELARTQGHGNAWVAGMLASLTPRLEAAIHLRNYQRNFISIYPNAFAESTTPQNEQGLYWGWKYTFSKKMAVQGYIDQFRFPWLRYRAYAPGGVGHEWLARWTWLFSKTTGLFVQYRQEQKDRNIVTDNPAYQVAPATKQNLWINLHYGDGPLRFRTRYQWSAFAHHASLTHGMVLLQDVTYQTRRLTLSMRYALFDTDDFDNRQYVFERDVWLAFSLPAYFGRGVRQYALLQYDLTRKCTVWFRWAMTRHTDRQSIGSGADRIDSGTVNDLKFQVRFTL